MRGDGWIRWAALAGGTAIVMASSAALGDWVPPFKGNDTGGIIAWALAQQSDAHQMALDHCARYGRVPKPLAVQPYYGGYISFACVLPRVPVAAPGAISVKG